MEATVNETTLRLVKGDITQQTADAIVNAANPTLMGGGGVDGAIHRKAGPTVLQELIRIRNEQHPRGLPIGEAVTTTAGDLDARHIIHTVGPIWRGGSYGEPTLLAQAYRNSLKQATAHSHKTVALPSISTGHYGYPIDQAAETALKAIIQTLQQETTLTTVTMVLYTDEALEAYTQALQRLTA